MELTWDDLSGEPRTSGSQLVYEQCPQCRDRRWKFYVNPDTGQWFCFAGLHNAGGQLPVRTGNQIVWPRSGTVPAWQPVEIPDVRPLPAEALAYLARRGIDPQWARAFGLSESALYPGRIMVPFFWHGDLVYWTSRAYSAQAHGPKYVAAPGRHPLYVVGGHGMDDAPSVVVEGPMDAMHVAMSHCRAIALCGKSLPAYLEPMMKELTENKQVLVMLDTDAIGDTIRVANRIERIADCTVKCLVAAGYKDPGEIPPNEIRKLVYDATR